MLVIADFRSGKKCCLSHVAAIVDDQGGLRTVVTRILADFAYHLGPREKLFVVPDFLVSEPVPWDAIPFVIRRSSDCVKEWIRSRNDPDALRHPAIAAYRKRYGLP